MVWNKINFSVDEVEEMISFYHNVKSTRKVGKRFGISKGTVSKILKENGVCLKTVTKTQKDIDMISDLYKKYGSVTKVSEITGIKSDTINKYLGDNKKKYYKHNKYEQKYSYDETIFDVIDTEEKAYWLGFMYADGCVVDGKGYPCCATIGLQYKDWQHVVKFVDFIGGEKEMIKFNKSKNRVDVKINNRHMSEALVRLGCIPRKSLILKFPNEKQVPKHLLRHFIRGYFDGDGTLYKRSRGSYCFGFVGTYDVIENITQYIQTQINISNVKMYRKDSKNTWEWKKEGVQALECAKFLYKNANVYLDRKYEIIRPFME